MLYSTSKSRNLALKYMQQSLKSLERWCKTNGIYMNLNKTRFMLFGSKITLAKVQHTEVNLLINKQPITRVHTYCYLGITLDEQLNFELHTWQTIRKVKNKLVQLRSLRFFLNKKSALIWFTKNMILPILQIMQNKA